MKRDSKVISIQRASSFRLDPILTGEEAIILRALASGHTDRQVCSELRMNPDTYLRMMRDYARKNRQVGQRFPGRVGEGADPRQ